MRPPFELNDLAAHTALLMDSYARITGRKLIDVDPFSPSAADILFNAPFVLLSHGTEQDPVLNYGNKNALLLWEMEWEVFTSTPSRLTAEPMERGQREKLLRDAQRQGYSDGYTGIRISSTGKRFQIENAVIWSVIDQEGQYRGQAAMFPEWRPI